MHGDRLCQSVRPGVGVEITREAIGVIGIITPWNFPMATASWKIAPALAYGNAVIWKPSNLTPASAWALTEIISRQGLPAGAFNLVMGPGSSIGNALASSPDIDAITLTGSYETGRAVAIAAAPNLTKLQLEMGSKNALVVMDDADIDLAVAHAVNGAFFGSGQKCTASSRIVVDRKVHDVFARKFVKAAAARRSATPWMKARRSGRWSTRTSLPRPSAMWRSAKPPAPNSPLAGNGWSAVQRATISQPTVFLGTKNEMRMNREEMFVPIACVIEVESFEHAVSVVNDTEFGLTAGIMTRSLKYATHFKRNSEAGMVMVNVPTARR